MLAALPCAFVVLYLLTLFDLCPVVHPVVGYSVALICAGLFTVIQDFSK